MSQPTSFFLDVLRVVAALAVFFYHCVLFWYPGHTQGVVGELGHRSVIVFFVLSGYVIAYATLKKESDPRSYVVARLSRLYSVVAPALVLTFLLQLAGTWLHPSFYAGMDRGHGLLRYALTSFFLQSLWTMNAAPPTNGPFWSLGYEFWYYAIFGAFIFVQPWRRKLIVTLVLLAISGIDSLLLMPAWIMGVLLYLWGPKFVGTRGAALAGGVAALAGTLLAILYLPDCPWHYGYPPFFYSSAFVSDACIGLLLTALIWCVDQIFRGGQVPDRLDAPVRWAADHTFSLYLYHFPLVLFTAAVIPFDRSSPLQVGLIVAVILAIIVFLSAVTQSTRPYWRKLFGGFWTEARSSRA